MKSETEAKKDMCSECKHFIRCPRDYQCPALRELLRMTDEMKHQAWEMDERGP